jgi:hypothetical protein
LAVNSITLVLAILCGGQADTPIDGVALFALFERYHSSFRDIGFVHEGTLENFREKSDRPADLYRFQTYYAYRNDGATLLDVFGRKTPDKPMNRLIASVLHDRLEMLNATPDRGTKVRARVPQAGAGGPGSLARYDSPERIFLAWYFPTLGSPEEHELKMEGWDDVGGHRCLRVRMLRQPRSMLKGWVGGMPFVRLWIDPSRDGYPIRFEYYRGDDLEVRSEVSRMEHLNLPDGRSIWFPAEGRTLTWVGQDGHGQLTHTKEPSSIETHAILLGTVKFNRGLADSFFSVKQHAAAANDEILVKLQHEIEEKVPTKKPLPADPESRRKRLDEAVAEADRQAKGLEASSLARGSAGWSDVLSSGLGLIGVLALVGAGVAIWRAR